jgi:esterase/lipase superfamily enzyme
MIAMKESGFSAGQIESSCTTWGFDAGAVQTLSSSVATGGKAWAELEKSKREASFSRAPEGTISANPNLVPDTEHRYLPLYEDRSPFYVDCRTKNGLKGPANQTPSYEVWFGTNRAPYDKEHPQIGFSDQRSGLLHYGIACVYVPKSHSFGSVGSWWVRRVVTGTDDRLTIESINPLEKDEFINALKFSLSSKGVGPCKALIYIHGYNVTFEEAVIRAAQIGYDLKVEGITAVYSWPSKGSLLGYAADEATVESSEEFAKEFLELVALQSGAEEVDVIAHSMGNRALLRAVGALAPAMKSAGKKFGQIFLAAPDVDIDTFKQLANIYPSISTRTTLYVSSGDLALNASAFVHGGYSRAGFYPPITTLPGIDTIQVSNVDLTLLGHGYFSSLEPVLHDMFDLLRSNLAPSQRIRLRHSNAELEHWEIAP